MLRVRQLRARRGQHLICKIDSLDVDAGETVVVHGPNGCGKTTLLRILGGLETRFDGTVDIGVASGDCVFVHQDPILFGSSVIENVFYGLRARGVKNRAGDAQELMKDLDIQHLASHHALTLSAGERRRVAIARALVLKPRLLLLDEPFDELDRDGVERVRSVLQSLEHGTIMIASPDPLGGGHRHVELKSALRNSENAS